MNLLDENFPDDQRLLLEKWGIHVRQVGRGIAEVGTADDAIIPLLHRLKNVTFFTHDQDFFKRRYCHLAYCLVWLDVVEDEMATYTRRFLRAQTFATKAQRMGIVARVTTRSLQYWHRDQTAKVTLRWA